MSAYVYLLNHSSQPRFKIGKAVDILQRTRQIGVSQFDLTTSSALEAESEDAANNVERLLHRAFANWRLPSEDVLANGGVRDGASEWFSSDCRERLNEFIAANSDLIGCKTLPASWIVEQAKTWAAGDKLTQERRSKADAKQLALAEKLRVKEEAREKALIKELENFRSHLIGYREQICDLARLATFSALLDRDLLLEIPIAHEDDARVLIENLIDADFQYDNPAMFGNTGLFTSVTTQVHSEYLRVCAKAIPPDDEHPFVGALHRLTKEIAAPIAGWGAPFDDATRSKAIELQTELDRPLVWPSSASPGI